MAKSVKGSKTLRPSPEDQPHRGKKARPLDLIPLERVEPAGPTRLLLVDSSQIFREGLALILQGEPNIQLVGQLEAGEPVYSEMAALDADVSIVDVDLPDRSGIEVAHWLKQKCPSMSVLLLCHWDWDVYLIAAQIARAAGVLCRGMSAPDLLRQVREARSGPAYSVEQQYRIRQWEKEVGSRLKKLRPREWEILWQVAMGYKNKEIAGVLSVSENTVEKYVSAVLEKVHLPSRSGLVAFIYRNHLDVLIRLPVERRYLYLSPGNEAQKSD